MLQKHRSYLTQYYSPRIRSRPQNLFTISDALLSSLLLNNLRPSLLLSWSYHRTSLAVHSTILKGGKSWRWRVEWHKNCAEKYKKRKCALEGIERNFHCISSSSRCCCPLLHHGCISQFLIARGALFIMHFFSSNFSALDFVSAKFQKIPRPRQKRENCKRFTPTFDTFR